MDAGIFEYQLKQLAIVMLFSGEGPHPVAWLPVYVHIGEGPVCWLHCALHDSSPPATFPCRPPVTPLAGNAAVVAYDKPWAARRALQPTGT